MVAVVRACIAGQNEHTSLISQMCADHHDCMFPQSTQHTKKALDLGSNVGIDERVVTQHARTHIQLADVGDVHEVEDGPTKKRCR